MNGIADFRGRQRLQAQIDASLRDQFAAFQSNITQQMAMMNAELAALVAAQGQLIAKQQMIIDDLGKTLKPTSLGDTSVTVPGALVSLSLATTRRWVNPLAGVRPGDYLQPIMSEYLPEGWSLPQLVCRNAGQIEVRIAVPQLGVGTPARSIAFGVLALRAVPLS